ncbi:MAG: hypothetical protein R3E94_03225 [Burkholderiaceae bacterium]
MSIVPARRLLLACAILPLCMGVTAPASLAREPDERGLHEAVRRGDLLPLETIRGHALTHFGGRVIEVELDRDRRGLVYAIDLLLEDGRKLELAYDARTGELIKVEGHRLETVFGRDGRPLP